MSILNAVATTKNKSFYTVGSYEDNSLGLKSFSGTFSIAPNPPLVGLNQGAMGQELSSTNIKIYSNNNSLIGTARAGYSFFEPINNYFGLLFEVETTTLDLGIASVRLLFDYPTNNTLISLSTSSKGTLRDGHFSAAWSRCLRTKVIIPVGNATILAQPS